MCTAMASIKCVCASLSFYEGVISFSLKAVFNILRTSSEPDAQNFDFCSIITSSGLNISIISGLMLHMSLLIQRNALA